MANKKPTQYALLGIEAIELCFPQEQVLNINSIGDVQASATTHQQIGSVRHHDAVLPVFAFSADLQPMMAAAHEHRFCVSFHIDGEPSFALACDSVASLVVDRLEASQALPEVMKHDCTPIQALFQHGDRLALETDAGAMHDYLAHVGAWDE